MHLSTHAPTTLPYTAAAQRALNRAAAYAAGQPITPEQVLLAVLDQPRSLAIQTLQRLNVDVSVLRQTLDAQLPATTPARTPPVYAEATRQAMLAATTEAQHLGHYQVDAIHLLLGLLYNREARVSRALDAVGVSLFTLRQALLDGPRRWRWHGWASIWTQFRAVVSVSPIFLVLLVLFLGSGVALCLSPAENYIRPLTILFVVCGWIVALCLHEFGHAIAAYFGGDQSMATSGYLGLNPLRYAHPFISIILPVIFLLAGGLGLPGGAVYVNTAALRGSRWERIVAAAGPLATMLCGLITALPFWFPWDTWWLNTANVSFWPALALLCFLQVSALIFNLLPIPPLDGFNVIAPSLPLDLRMRLRMVSGMLTMVLFSLLWYDSPIADAYWRMVFDVAETAGLPLWLIGIGFEQLGV